MITYSGERYHGSFFCHYVFAVTFVYVTSERLIIRRSNVWITSWTIHLVLAGIGGPLLFSGTLPLLALGAFIIAIAIVGSGLVIREKGRQFQWPNRTELQPRDIVLVRNQILQVELKPPSSFHVGWIIITSLVHDPIKLPINAKRIFRVATLVLKRFNPSVVRETT